MPTTSNFGWTTPADTDLVKDGAAAIRTLGNGIDTSLIDLKGGTTGQVLSKASNADLDFSWTAGGDITEVQAGVGISISSGTGPIPVITNSSTDLITTAGDLLYGTAADTVARLGIGTANQVLAVNSGATAPQWVTPSSGALVKIAGASFSGVATVSLDSMFSSTYLNYFTTWNISDTDGNIRLRFRASGADNTTGNYYTAYHNSTYAGTISNTGISGGTYALDLPGSGTSPRFALTFMNPNVSGAQTQGFGQNVRGDSSAGSVFVDFGGGTAFTGFSIYTAGSTMTGDYAVYGYVK